MPNAFFSGAILSHSCHSSVDVRCYVVLLVKFNTHTHTQTATQTNTRTDRERKILAPVCALYCNNTRGTYSADFVSKYDCTQMQRIKPNITQGSKQIVSIRLLGDQAFGAMFIVCSLPCDDAPGVVMGFTPQLSV